MSKTYGKLGEMAGEHPGTVVFLVALVIILCFSALSYMQSSEQPVANSLEGKEAEHE